MMSGWLRTLSGYVRNQRIEWARSNPSRLKYEPGPLTRLFQAASASPLPWVGWVFAVLLLGTWLSAFHFPPPYPGFWDFGPTDSKYSPSAAFVGLWAVQGAMVAVVYPIVVAFVTVLIQRQAASKASLEAYFVASSAKLTGLSSISLVLLMAIQFLFLDAVAPLTGFAWLVVDGAWFVLNSLLSLNFLAATFDFAPPDGRIRARNRFVLTRAWPEEWAYHLSRLIALEPVKYKLLTAPAAMDDLDSKLPAFSAFPRQVGTHAGLQLSFRGAARVVDIRYRVLQWAFNLWAKNSNTRTALTAGGERASFARKGPVLEVGVFVHEEFSHGEPVFRIGGTGLPSAIERLLLRASVSLASSEHPRVTVMDALDEARLDASTAVQQDSVADFEKRLAEFIEFFDQLIESSNFVQEGKADNWSLLQSSDNLWGGRTIGQQWEKSFLDLHSVALSAVERRSDFAEHTVRVPSRFFLRQREYLCAALRLRYVSLQYWHLRLLLDWGAERLAAAPVASGGRLLEEPLRRRYEDLLKEGVSAWESLKNWRLGLELKDSAEWEQLQEAAPLFETHLRQSAALVAACLRADDRAGLYWFGDSFLKWRSQLERYRTSEGVAYVDRFKVVYDDLLLSLQDFREKFPLDEYEREDEDSLRAAWHLALGNLWTDVGLVLLATTITHPGTTDSRQELSANFVRSAIGGVQDDSASAGSERLVDGPDRVVSSLIRVHALGSAGDEEYNRRLEKVSESLVPSAVSEGIAGRIYSSIGAPLEGLDDGYLLLMALSASRAWQVSSRFDEAIRAWTEQDGVRQSLLRHLQRLRDRAREGELAGRFEHLWRRLARDEEANSLTARLAVVAAALDAFIRRIEAARTLDIQNLEAHAGELERVSGYAAQGLLPPFVEAPLSLFEAVASSDESFADDEKRSLRLTGWEKGSLTRPRLAEPVSNEDEYIRDVVRQTVSIEVVRDVLRTCPAKLQGVATKEEFLAEVERFGREAVAAGARPLLLVASRAEPTWLIELARRGSGPDGHPLFRRVANREDVPSYSGNIGDTEVHVAPIPRGESLLCKASLFQQLVVSSGVASEAQTEAEVHRCTLKLSWGQRANFDGSEVIRLQHAKPPSKRRRSAPKAKRP